jgi:hypothetical protein
MDSNINGDNKPESN